MTPKEKQDLSERDICTKFINPSIQKAGWNIDTQVREEVSFTDGRIYVRGKLHTRGAQKRADYILYYKPNIPIAVIEAKDNKHTVASGIQQAIDYAKTLEIPFVLSSNGDGFIFHDRTITSGEIESELNLDSFPSPEVLWEKYKDYKGISESAAPIVSQEYFADGSGRSPPATTSRSPSSPSIPSSASAPHRRLFVPLEASPHTTKPSTNSRLTYTRPLKPDPDS